MNVTSSTNVQQADVRQPTGGESPAQRRRLGPRDDSGLQARSSAPDAGSPSRPRQTITELHTRYFDDQSSRSELRHVGAAGIEKFANLDGKELASDSHMHPTNYSQRGLDPKELLKRMDEIGIRNTTLMPIPTSIISPIQDADRKDLHNHHCGEPYYIPAAHANIKPHELTPAIRQQIVKGTELFVDTEVDASAAFRLKNSGLTQAQMDRFDPMITGLHLGSPISGDALLRKLHEHKGMFTGIGEITLHKELVEDMFAGRAQANLKDRVEAFKDLMNVAGVVGMPVVLHCDVDSLDNQAHRDQPSHKPAHLEGLKSLFSDPKVANTDIVWAHAGGLGRFVMEPKGHDNELQKMLDLHPRLNIDLSWSRVAEQLTATPQAMDRWAAFLEKNNTRVLFGSDTLSPSNNQKWDETRQIYGKLLDRLSDGARANILNGNYDRVFVAARPKVREFEEKVLTPEFYSTKLMATDGPRTTADWLRPLAEKARAEPSTAGADDKKQWPLDALAAAPRSKLSTAAWDNPASWGGLPGGHRPDTSAS